MALGDDIKRKRKALGLSAEALARRIGVSKDNIYKWEKGTKPSDAKDYLKITRWLEGEIEIVPKTEKPGSENYQADRIKELEEKYIRKLEENEAWLKKIVESSLGDIVERQRTIQAEIQAVQQWDVQIEAGGDKAKAEAALGHIRTLVAHNREKLSKKNIDAGVGK